ncbi:MAG TPA: transglycosylase family protein [Solirubrobacterales bacterium]|nr:transglycosylase family protein [Solirubrobacterales bacterium]
MAALAVGVTIALPTAGAGAQSVDELNTQIASAQSQAQSLGAEIDASASRLATARSEAAAAAAREAELSAVLAQGQEREAQLQIRVTETAARLAEARARLRRALGALAARLVSIYKGGGPDATELLLDSRGFDDLANRAELLGRIEDADAALAARVRQLRNLVSAQLAEVKRARAEAVAFNQRIAAARDAIAGVRATAEARAAQLEQARAEQAAALASLQSQVASWEAQVQQAQQVSAAQAQQTVSDWFGDWAIPQAIVMCESGGNFGAVNPSSGAGGAYQILPSTWRLYGGRGAPQDASPEEQSAIASQIWADSGPSAWVCAQ